MATAAERRAAQRRLAREIHAGTYEPGIPGKSYHQARRRQRRVRRRVDGYMGVKGWEYQQFDTLREAFDEAKALPPLSSAMITARGTLSSTSPREDAVGEKAWRTVVSSASPDYFNDAAYQIAIQRIAELFDDEPDRYTLLVLIP